MPARTRSAAVPPPRPRTGRGHDPTLAERLEFVRDSLVAASLALADEPLHREEMRRSRRELAGVIASLHARPAGSGLLTDLRRLLETLDGLATDAHPRSAA